MAVETGTGRMRSWTAGRAGRLERHALCRDTSVPFQLSHKQQHFLGNTPLSAWCWHVNGTGISVV